MAEPVRFDHIEVHVRDIPAYGRFLSKLFRGGRYKQISDSGTSMFISPDGLCIEVKARRTDDEPDRSGFCLPCLRTPDARGLIEDDLQLSIGSTITNPEGLVHFFSDHEGVEWHVKEYAHADRYVNW